MRRTRSLLRNIVATGILATLATLVSGCQSQVAKSTNFSQKTSSEELAPGRIESTEPQPTVSQASIGLGVDVSESTELIIEILRYCITVNAMSKEQTVQEISAVNEELTQVNATILKLKRACLLSHSSYLANTTDSLKRTIDVLEDISSDLKVYQDYRLFAQFMLKNLKVRERNILRQKALASDLSKIQQQLDALTDVEVKINEREPIQGGDTELPKP